MKYYAGVGSRRTPTPVLQTMTRVARRLKELGWVLRSGAADGADWAFEQGARPVAEIFLPWPGFNRRGGLEEDCPKYFKRPTREAFAMVSVLHPRWKSLSSPAQSLHARNCHQILGHDLVTPVKFVLCWTVDGARTEEECSKNTGGTATAIRLAHRNNIPVFNLQRGQEQTLEELKHIVCGEPKCETS